MPSHARHRKEASSALQRLLVAVLFSLGFGLGGLGVAVASPTVADGSQEPEIGTLEMTERTSTATRVDELIAQHDCWRSGEQPKVPIPGHVIGMRPGSEVPQRLGRTFTEEALDQVVGIDHGLRFYAFCV